MTEQTYECSEIPVFSVIHENSKMFKQDCCLTYAKHQWHVKWWKMYVILVFLIAGDWFSQIIASKVVCI